MRSVLRKVRNAPRPALCVIRHRKKSEAGLSDFEKAKDGFVNLQSSDSQLTGGTGGGAATAPSGILKPPGASPSDSSVAAGDSSSATEINPSEPGGTVPGSPRASFAPALATVAESEPLNVTGLDQPFPSTVGGSPEDDHSDSEEEPFDTVLENETARMKRKYQHYFHELKVFAFDSWPKKTPETSQRFIQQYSAIHDYINWCIDDMNELKKGGVVLTGRDAVRRVVSEWQDGSERTVGWRMEGEGGNESVGWKVDGWV